MVEASAAGSVTSFAIGVYVIGVLVALFVYRVQGFRNQSFNLRRLVRPRRRDARRDFRGALAWPAAVYRHALGSGGGVRPTLADQPAQAHPVADSASAPAEGAGSPAGGLEMKKYGLINEDDD
jgi:hypothetical protein